MQSARRNQDGVRLDRQPGDHHHFVTSLRPGRDAPTCVAPSFHAAPKLRGSPRNSARQSVRGRSPIQASRTAEPSTPRTLVAGVLGLVAAPQSQPQQIQPQQHRPVPPADEGATARLIGRVGSVRGDSLGHSSRPSTRVEDVHTETQRHREAHTDARVQRERDKPAAARPRGKSASPRRPHSSQHAQRPGSSPRESPAPAHKMQGPASPYNIEQYIRMMWDTDRAAALDTQRDIERERQRERQRERLTSACRHQDPELPQPPVALRANVAAATAAVPVAAVDRQRQRDRDRETETERAPLAEAGLVVGGVSATASASRFPPAEQTGGCAPGKDIPQQLEQPQDRLQDQEKSSSVMQASSSGIADPASEQPGDHPAGFVTSSWREVAQPDFQSSCVASGPRLSHFGAPAPTEWLSLDRDRGRGRDRHLPADTTRQRSVKARGGAFGKFEMRKAAAARQGHQAYPPIQDGINMPLQAASGLVGKPHTPRARASAAAPPRQVTPSINTLNLLEGVQTQLSLGNGTSSMQPTAESGAPVYSWRPIDSLKWIPGVVPARGPPLYPWPQQERAFSPRAMNTAAGVHSTHLVGLDARPASADVAVQWTEEAVKISRAPGQNA